MVAPTLGVVAISRNEEEDLNGFLENLLPWVDEIVIIDDGSTDLTLELARSAGEKVNAVPSPRGDGEYFASQRNLGIDTAKSDWLLHMDIDERVSAELGLEILLAVRSSEHDAYRFRRLNYFLHRPMRGGGLADWNQVHLARRECLRFGGMYHEEIQLSVPENRVGQLKGLMLHLNDRSFLERLQKSSSYQMEAAERIRSTKKRLGYRHIWFSFVWSFLYKYFFKLGFLDGSAGLIWALHSATAEFRAHALVWDEQNRIPRSKLESEVRKSWRDGFSKEN